MHSDEQAQEKWPVAIADADPRRLQLVKAILLEAGYATQLHARHGNKRRGQGTVVLAHDSCAETFDELLAHCVETLHPLVLYSEAPSIACVVERMTRGAAGCLDWPFSGEDAAKAIERARRVGGKTMTLLNEERQALELIARLTRREKEVLGYLAAGLTTKKMAEDMGLPANGRYFQVACSQEDRWQPCDSLQGGIHFLAWPTISSAQEPMARHVATQRPVFTPF